MRIINPNDPIYKGLTRDELMRIKHFSPQEKEAISVALFGESIFGPSSWQKHRDQRWAALLGEVAPAGKPYYITREDIRNRVASLVHHRAETSAENESTTRASTVSAFSDWVIRLYVPERSNAALVAGLEGERAIVAHRLRIQRAKRQIPRWEYHGWKLVHDGVRGAFESGFSIPSLEVGGVTMTGVPDLVFRERKSGRILIVELKVSQAMLPSDGWPNLRAQLWAYSRIEKWSVAPEILLAGEVWSPESAGLQRRRTYQWRASDEDLQAESRELFEAYGGQVLQ